MQDSCELCKTMHTLMKLVKQCNYTLVILVKPCTTFVS